MDDFKETVFSQNNRKITYSDYESMHKTHASLGQTNSQQRGGQVSTMSHPLLRSHWPVIAVGRGRDGFFFCLFLDLIPSRLTTGQGRPHSEGFLGKINRAFGQKGEECSVCKRKG